LLRRLKRISPKVRSMHLPILGSATLRGEVFEDFESPSNSASDGDKYASADANDESHFDRASPVAPKT
jgi:hypothetical protein